MNILRNGIKSLGVDLCPDKRKTKSSKVVIRGKGKLLAREITFSTYEAIPAWGGSGGGGMEGEGERGSQWGKKGGREEDGRG